MRRWVINPYIGKCPLYSLFSLMSVIQVSSLDRNSCAKQLVCELGALEESSGLVSQEEAGIMALFSAESPEENPADSSTESSADSSAREQYERAVRLGRTARSVQVCRHR